jgi:hypothetical protein
MHKGILYKITLSSFLCFPPFLPLSLSLVFWMLCDHNLFCGAKALCAHRCFIAWHLFNASSYHCVVSHG